MTRREMSAEQRAKISASLKGHVKTPEHRARLSASLKGRPRNPETEAKRLVSRTYVKQTEHYKTPTYHSWDNMIQRCTNTHRTEYSYYGGRGITVCQQWRTFANFLADMGERPEGLTLDRVNTDGNYEPGNCRWATRAEQSRNRRRNSNYDRSPRVNECGHPDLPHKSRGMCGTCYARWRREGKVA